MLDRLVVALLASSFLVAAASCDTPAGGRIAATATSPTAVVTLEMTDTPSRPTAGYTETPLTPTETSPVPSVTPTGVPGPFQAVAYYCAGSEGQYHLFALSGAGASQFLDHQVQPWAVVSPDGRWVASASDSHPAPDITLRDIGRGTTYTVTVTADADASGMAFDQESRRLAFLELASPEGMRTPWALVVFDLDNQLTTRYRSTYGQETGVLPANPIGWSGDKLLVNSFIPFTEVGSAGLWTITLPDDDQGASIDALDRQEILPGDSYLFEPDLSPKGRRLLILNRDYSYSPENYQPVGYDLAVNELGIVNVMDGATTFLVEEEAGGALGGDAAWSPDGTRVLFARGKYGGGTFATLSLSTVDETGAVRQGPSLPLPPDGFLVSVDWCDDDRPFVVMATSDGEHQLHAVDLGSGSSILLASDDYLEVLGCISGNAGGTRGNADVVRVRAVQTAGPAPGAGQTTWTFHVTIQHPDTGWEDYVNGWDVVTTEGQVLKPDPESEFTRTLLHPHVEEQPFTRSQSRIVVHEGVTEVWVRAHDIVHGYGGREVLVDLTQQAGPDFEVGRE